MKKHTKFLLALATTSLITTNALASGLVGVTGTLKNIEKSVNTAVQESSRYYEEKRGAPLSQTFNLLTANNANPYLSSLNILDDYKVVMQLSGANPGTTQSIVTSPVAQALLGKTFIFVPVYNTGDEVITSWECLTNADHDVQEFIGSAGAIENSRSYIAGQTSNKYLTNCIYIQDVTPYAPGINLE